MTQISVPKRHSDAIARLAALEPAAVAKLAEQIDSSPGPSTLETRVLDAAGPLSFEALVALNATRLSLAMPAAEAAAQAIESIGTEVGSDGLAALLEHPILVRQAKYTDLRAATERSLHVARVLTDIRPLFGEDPATDIEAVLITQTLQLIYFEDGSYTEIYVSLDSADLRHLRDQAERALAKGETAKRFAVDRGVIVLDDPEEESR